MGPPQGEPARAYHVEDWGVENEAPRHGAARQAEGRRESPVKEPADWANIRPLDPTSGTLGEMLDAEERIAADIQGDTDWVMTVFNPISIAADLINDDERFVDHLRHHGERVHEALRAITETFLASPAKPCARRLRDPLRHDRLGERDHIDATLPGVRTSVRPPRARRDAGGLLNVIHVCGPRASCGSISTTRSRSCPGPTTTRAIPPSRDPRRHTTRPSSPESTTKGTVLKGPPEAVQAQARAAIEESQGTRFILGPGCAVPSAAPERHYAAAREAVLACA